MGRVTILGAGPGDPGLLTRRGEERLNHAQVVILDSNLAEDLAELIPPTADRFVVGRRVSGFTPVEPEVLPELIIERAERGQNVVRLKTGDPFIFGSGSEEIIRCRAARIPVEVIPGVSRVFASPALAGIPLILRGVAGSVLILPGRVSRQSLSPRPIAPVIEDQQGGSATGNNMERRTGVVVKKSPAKATKAPADDSPRGRRDYGLSISDREVVVLHSDTHPPEITASREMVASPPGMRQSSALLHASSSGEVQRPEVEQSASFYSDVEEPPLGEDAFLLDWATTAKAADTLVFEGVVDPAVIRAGLLEGGRSPAEPVALISRGATNSQHTVIATVETMADEAGRRRIALPLTVVVGDVVNLREHLLEFERRPLFGMRLAIPRRAVPGERTEEVIRSTGAKPIPFPLITNHRSVGLSELIASLREDFGQATHLLVDSPEAAEGLAVALEEEWLDWRVLPLTTKVLAVGEATRRSLESRGLRAEMIERDEISPESILGAGDRLGARNPHILLAGENSLWHGLAETLRSCKAEVVELPVFEQQTLLANVILLRHALTRGQLDGIIFFTPEEVRICLDAWTPMTAHRLLRDVVVGVLDKSTAEALAPAMKAPVCLPKHPDLEELLEEISARRTPRPPA